jgi:hypothetical protein
MHKGHAKPTFLFDAYLQSHPWINKKRRKTEDVFTFIDEWVRRWICNYYTKNESNEDDWDKKLYGDFKSNQ